jgi:CTP:molybdopterin cytidylyltransferase MocA
MNPSRFAAVVLAGGLSTRMKQFKPLLPLGETTVTDHVISTFRDLGLDVYLVAGHRYEETKASINRQDVTIIYNPDYEKGMFSSIQAGVRNLKPDYQAFFILPVDIPLVKQTTIGQIVDEWLADPDKIIYPTFDGKRGHPPLIPSGLIPDILRWEKEGGLKAFLKTHGKSALEVPVNDGNILMDIDTPEDYKKLLEHYRQET